MLRKNPLTLVGIEPATFRFVAQHLNHCATAVPTTSRNIQKFYILPTEYLYLLYVSQEKRRSFPYTAWTTGFYNRGSEFLGASSSLCWFNNKEFSVLYLQSRPASWSSGQSLWLLIMRSRVRFPVLPWEFNLKGRIPAVTMVWVG